MDGRRTTRCISTGLRGAVCIAASALLIGGVVTAEPPPLFELQGVPQPISSPLARRAQVKLAPRSESTVARPLIHKPRARVVAVPETSLITVRANTSEADTAAPHQSSSAPDALNAADRHTAASSGRNPSTIRMTVEEALETKGSVTFRKTPLSEVVFLLSDLWQVNIVAGENVDGQVSGTFQNAPLREVLSATLAATGYGYRQTGSSLVVLPVDQVGADDPSFESETIRLASPLGDDGAMLEAARLLLSDRGQMRNVGNKTVLVVDTPQRIARIRQLFTDLAPAPTPPDPGTMISSPSDQALVGTAPKPELLHSGIAYFTPQFTEAEEMSEPLREALGENVIVAVYPEENRILVKGAEGDLRLASEAIRQLDRPRPQVRITAMIYDVSLKEVQRLGIDWSVRPHSSSLALTDLNDPESLRFRNLFSAATEFVADPTAPGTAGLGVSSINSNINVDALLQALDGSSEAKLLADPSVSVGDRHEASIRLVQKIPIVAANPVENSSVVFTQVQFEEAGIILNVVPRISRDGTIELNVQPEYSVVVDFIENNPVIDSRTAQTVVRVANGQTFVLGGLRQKNIVESIRGVPFLQDIKYLGKFFQSHDTEVRESELIVFLRPEVTTPFHAGSLREQQAARVATIQLDQIPYAETIPMTPCCKDCNCPNHFPRPRINGGAQSLGMMGGSGFVPAGQYDGQVIEIVGEKPPEGHERAYQSEISGKESRRVPNVVIQEVFPPIHIDTQASQ